MKYTWEEAVIWMREQPDKQDLVRDCYYDDPLLTTAERFAQSLEWRATMAYLPHRPGTVLDLAAGRGISSYALARDGWQVTALEPDSSSLVGAQAIRDLARQSGMLINVIEEYGEELPFEEYKFDLVYSRQALHHAHDLPVFCREAALVLKPGGTFIATREHVISRPSDLGIFLQNHPLHRFYGGENAFLIEEYLSSIADSGLQIRKVLGPYDSPINYFPMTYLEWQQACNGPLSRIVGNRAARILTNPSHLIGKWLLGQLARRISNKSDMPGRLYSFVAQKPQI